MALALGLNVDLELSKLACFPAVPQLMLDAPALKLVPFVSRTGARKVAACRRTPGDAGISPPERFDCACLRDDTVNLFRISDPLSGWQRVQGTATDFAEVLRRPVEDLCADAEKGVVDRHREPAAGGVTSPSRHGPP